MSALAKKILEEARNLSSEERRSVALELLEEDDADGSVEEVEQAWLSEVEHRMNELKAGRSRLIPLDEAMTMLRERRSAR